VVDALGLDVGSLGGVDTPLGMRTGLRLSFETGTPDTWKQYLRVDWGDEGPAETWLANVNILGLSFYGWLVRYGLNDALIDPSVNVFGPNTVDPGFNSTGEKTLLTMSTTLPAGGKNVIIVAYQTTHATVAPPAAGTYRIKKGATILYETPISNEVLHIWSNLKPKMVIAIDNAPAGNDVYTLTINIVQGASGSAAVHVQAIVIKTDDATFAANTATVSIAAGATSTVLTLGTTYPLGSKVAVIATVVISSNTYPPGDLISANNVRLKLGTTIVSSNQFTNGGTTWGGAQYPINQHLIYFTTLTDSNQTWSIEVYNNSANTVVAYAVIVAFTTNDGAFLDTGSVGLSNGSQTTVGSLTTSLSGDVVAIGLAAAENSGTAEVVAFNAGDVVLQLNNSSTGQIGNLVSWIFANSSTHGRSGVLPLFRLDTGVSNPSYQIKMTARVAGINGEAKILAFVPKSGQTFTVSLTETLTSTDVLARIPNYVRVLAETLTASDSLRRLQTLARTMSETLTASDTVARIPNYVRLIAETVGITSTAYPAAALIALAETILIAESLQAIRIPFQPTPPTGPSGPPAEIPLPTPQQVFPIGLAVALGVVFAGAVYGVQRRRSMGAVMGRATQRRPRWKAGKMPRKRRWRDSLGE
jgi:hypothetical protein